MSDESPFLVDPFRSYCALSGHQTLLLENNFFISPGYYVRPPNRTIASSPWMRVVDLGRSFDVDDTGRETRVLPTSIWPAEVPVVQNGVLWYDSESKSALYAQGARLLAGGVYRDPALPNRVRMGKSWLGNFNPANRTFGSWKEIDTPFKGQVGSAVSRRTFYDDKSRKGYIYGGWVSEAGSDTNTDGVLTFDWVQGTWSNSTNPFGRFDSQGAAIPYRAPDGRLLSIIFGGRLGTNLLSMSTVFIHDIENNKWYRQDTNGGDPVPRRGFCSSIVSAPDGSSSQIYMYSGEVTGRSDLWALSLPSFTWSQVLRESPVELPGPGPRLQASCNIINNHILAVFGGRNHDGGDAERCDDDGDALFLFNLNTGEWQERYDQSDRAGYLVPEAVYKDIGGSSSGFATLTAPPNGFTDPDVEALFATSTGTPDNPPVDVGDGEDGGSGNDGGGDSGGGSSTNAGIIAGGVLGGVFFVLLVLCGIWWWRRGRSRKAPSPPAGDDWRMNGAYEISTSEYGTHRSSRPTNSYYAGSNTSPSEVYGSEPLKPLPEDPVELPGNTPSGGADSSQKEDYTKRV